MSHTYTAHPKHLHRLYRPPYSWPLSESQSAKPTTHEITKRKCQDPINIPESRSLDEEDDDDQDQLYGQNNNILHQIPDSDNDSLPETPPSSVEQLINPVIDPYNSDDNLLNLSPLPDIEPTYAQLRLKYE